jgi:hypothetical protein
MDYDQQSSGDYLNLVLYLDLDLDCIKITNERNNLVVYYNDRQNNKRHDMVLVSCKSQSSPIS